jgi:poly(3-hydroxybutyrate) depolymerase
MAGMNSSGAGGSNGGAGGKGNSGGSGGTAAGSSSGGSGGSGGTTGGGTSGGKAAPNPSSGCGKASPQTGSSGSPLMASSHQYYVKLPSGYDASKPYPLIFVFNPTNNPINWAEQNAGFEQNGAKDAWIRVYPHPANPSNGWGANDVSFFQGLYDAVTGAYCVDKARMFATGESSGGDFAGILGCEHANKLRAVGPCSTKNVGGYALDASSRKCTGQVNSIVMQGKNDSVVGPENGPKMRDFYRALNHCTNTSMPVQGYTDTLSNCVTFQGCDAGYDVYWCQHTDPNYSNTNHGWPAFAPKLIWQVWSAL